MDTDTQEILNKLKGLGADFAASVYATDIRDSEAEVQEYIRALKTYINSMDFMRLGQSINHKQWQAAAMKANKMSAEARRLGIIRFERPFTGIRQNINRKNQKEALQALSMIITIRVKVIELLGVS